VHRKNTVNLSLPRFGIIAGFLMIWLYIPAASPAQGITPLDPEEVIEAAISAAKDSESWGEQTVESIEVDGLGTVWRFNDELYAGPPVRTPEHAAALSGLGISTVLGVDSAPPAGFELAGEGIAAVHTPMTPGSVRSGEWMRMVRPMTWMEGPYYIHGDEDTAHPIALAAMANHLWTRRGASHALYSMTTIGVSRDRVPLWFAATRDQFYQPADSFAVVPESFPMALPPEPPRWWMREMKERVDFLRDARKVRWSTPPIAWDSTTHSEAETLWQTVGAMRRSGSVDGLDTDSLERLEAYARSLADALHPESDATREAREAAWRDLLNHCAVCHRAHRDLPGLSVPESINPAED